MRDIDEKPYSADEARVAKFFADAGIGGGDDPIGSIIASHAYLADERNRLRDGLEQIVQWAKAYPLSVFPEPDMTKAAKLLSDGGMTLDAISASNMRHVVEGVGKIAREVLATDGQIASKT